MTDPTPIVRRPYHEIKELKHIHGPYIVTEYEATDYVQKYNGDGSPGQWIAKGYKAKSYACSLCMEPWEPQT